MGDKIKFKISDLFNNSDYFDLIMLSVFTARSDLYKISILLEEKKDDEVMAAFIFKFSLGVLKNSYMLAYDVRKSHEYSLKSMQNWDKIKRKYDCLKKCNEGNENKLFSKDVLSNIRNQAFHYSFKNSDLKKISTIVELLKDEDFIISLPGEGIDYYNVDNIYYNYVISLWNKYVEDSKDKDDLSLFVKKIREMTTIIVNLFDLISYGYFISFTNIKVACRDKSVKLAKLSQINNRHLSCD